MRWKLEAERNMKPFFVFEGISNLMTRQENKGKTPIEKLYLNLLLIISEFFLFLLSCRTNNFLS